MNTPRVGLIGAGGISRVHADAWRSIGASVTVHSQDGAAALAEQYGFAVADTLDDLLAASGLVDIVTPTISHGTLALAAIAAGKDVVCEKPLAATPEEAQRVADAAEAAGVRLFPAHVVRYFPEYAELRRLVADGTVGRPAVLRFTRGGEAPRAGSWFFDEGAGGGIVLDQMIHDLDQALWLAGDVTRVYAVQSPPSREGLVPEQVTAHVVLTHDDGAISHVQGTWGPRGMVFRTSADIAGSDGTLAIDSRMHTASSVELPAGTAGAAGYLPPPAHAESPYTTQLRAFLTAIETGEEARVSPLDGVRAVMLATAAQESLRTGRAVEVDLSVHASAARAEALSA